MRTAIEEVFVCLSPVCFLALIIPSGPCPVSTAGCRPPRSLSTKASSHRYNTRTHAQTHKHSNKRIHLHKTQLYQYSRVCLNICRKCCIPYSAKKQKQKNIYSHGNSLDQNNGFQRPKQDESKQNPPTFQILNIGPGWVTSWPFNKNTHSPVSPLLQPLQVHHKWKSPPRRKQEATGKTAHGRAPSWHTHTHRHTHMNRKLHHPRACLSAPL